MVYRVLLLTYLIGIWVAIKGFLLRNELIKEIGINSYGRVLSSNELIMHRNNVTKRTSSVLPSLTHRSNQNNISNNFIGRTKVNKPQINIVSYTRSNSVKPITNTVHYNVKDRKVNLRANSNSVDAYPIPNKSFNLEINRNSNRVLAEENPVEIIVIRHRISDKGAIILAIVTSTSIIIPSLIIGSAMMVYSQI